MKVTRFQVFIISWMFIVLSSLVIQLSQAQYVILGIIVGWESEDIATWLNKRMK